MPISILSYIIHIKIYSNNILLMKTMEEKFICNI